MASKSDGEHATTPPINKPQFNDPDCDRVWFATFLFAESFNQIKDLFGFFQDYATPQEFHLMSKHITTIQEKFSHLITEYCKSLLEGLDSSSSIDAASVIPLFSSSAQCLHCFTLHLTCNFSGCDTDVFVPSPSIGGSNIYGKRSYVCMHTYVYVGI